MELIPLLSTIILAATIVTIVFAAFSYLAYRAREKKAPKTVVSDGAPAAAQFFKRYEAPRS
jgi:hypothetical protein